MRASVLGMKVCMKVSEVYRRALEPHKMRKVHCMKALVPHMMRREDYRRVLVCRKVSGHCLCLL